jgi:baculoviral IAP repeat-containing protein 6
MLRVCLFVSLAGSSSAIGTQESTAHLLVSDPNLIHVLVKFLSGTSPHGTNQHSPQVIQLVTSMMFSELSETVLVK